MSLYDRWILPRLLDLAMSQRQLGAYRAGLVSQAEGRVLEIGIGSVLNLPFYGPGVELILGLDPSEPLLSTAGRRARAAGREVGLMRASAAAIPLAEASVDSLVMTWTLCSIPHPLAALAEMRRVLRPGGKLLFVEHGLSPDPAVQRWQHRLTPLWRHIAGGCHLDRKIDGLVRAAGFEIQGLLTDYARGPRPFTFMYEGRACTKAGQGAASRSPAEPEACNARGSGGDTRAPRALPPRTRP
jgi:ubiquinone/menaquinone biosynthesis C-methylase UbiE